MQLHQPAWGGAAFSESSFLAPSFWFTAFPLFLTLPLFPSWLHFSFFFSGSCLFLGSLSSLGSRLSVCLSLPSFLRLFLTLSARLPFSFTPFLSSVLICHNWKINYIYILAVFLVFSPFRSEFKGRGNRVYISSSQGDRENYNPNTSPKLRCFPYEIPEGFFVLFRFVLMVAGDMRTPKFRQDKLIERRLK